MPPASGSSASGPSAFGSSAFGPQGSGTSASGSAASGTSASGPAGFGTSASGARHALFPGSFDPLTRGHLDLVRRCLQLFPRVTIGVAQNPDKQTLFSAEERAEMVRAATRGLAGAQVALIPGLIVHACRDLGADVIVRGVRSGTDFDYEVQMARTNRSMLPEVDTVLLAPSPEHAHVSSSLVRQIAALGGDVTAMVPPEVAAALAARFSGRKL